jgi:hypothetical protein
LKCSTVLPKNQIGPGEYVRNLEME